MQQRPSKTELLRAVAQFLLAEAYPAIADKRLNFRVLIAANLANVVATELETGPALIDSEVSRLEALLPDVAGDEHHESPAHRMARLNEELVLRLRSKQLDEKQRQQVWSHVKQTLIDTLGIVNPRFDTSAEIE